MGSLTAIAVSALLSSPGRAAEQLEPIQYNHPGLVVDLGVGLWAWPLPMDYDGDGDMDLVVSCPDTPYNGVYFFENPGKSGEKRAESGGNSNGSKDSPQPSPLGSPLPVFKPAVRLGPAVKNIQISHADGQERLFSPGFEYLNFREKCWDEKVKLPLPAEIDKQWKRYRANQWKAVDWDGDGDQDLLIGIEVWDDYGWDDAWDENGNWKNGPLHGFVYLVENLGGASGEKRAESGGDASRLAADRRSASDAPITYAPPVKLTTSNGKPIDTFGMPSPCAADFDGDGDLDLICGEFLDGFTWFENTGSRTEPKLAEGRRLAHVRPDRSVKGEIRMDLEMITPTAVDWDGDGDIDLVCGDEDGRVALIEHTGRVEGGMPCFESPRYFQQEARDVKFGALVTPFSVDWDQDGDEDLVCGNTAGYIGFIQNLGGEAEPQWDAPHRCGVYASFRVGDVRHSAGPKGSIQGPCEAKWGYTTLNVADWDADGIKDVVTNDIWGKVTWHRMLYFTDEGGYEPQKRPVISGTGAPIGLIANAPVQKPAWTWWTPKPGELATQWRTTPCVVDWNADGLNDLVMLDHEGYLAFFERSTIKGSDQSETTGEAGPSEISNFKSQISDAGADLALLPPKRLFKMEGPCEYDSKHKTVGDKQNDLLRLNTGRAGASGRRKLHVVDWDGDGRLDLLVNSQNANWLRNVRTDDEGFVWFKDMGPLDTRDLAGHDTAPTTVDWDKNGIPDLLVGAEDGRLYYKRNPRALALASEPRPSRSDGQGSNTSEPGPSGSGSLESAPKKITFGKESSTSPIAAAAPAAAGTLPHGRGSDGIVSSEFVFNEAPFKQCHASTIAQTPSGLVAAWFGGTKEGHEDVGIWVSRQENGKWTKPREVANGVQHSTLRYPCWNPVLFRHVIIFTVEAFETPSTLYLFYKCGPNPREWWGMVTTSNDDGGTWSTPVRLPETIDGPVKNKPVKLEGGGILCGSSTETDGWRVHFESIKTLEPLTWERIGPINDGQEFNAIQPSILTHGGQKLQILCRSQEGSIVTAWSDDNGRTWSPLERTSLPNPNSGTDAVTLADGRQLLVYNHTAKGRSPLNVAVSDDGKTWQAALVLEDEPGEYSYPAVIQTNDGLVHITYTWKREKVKHVIVNPAKLKLRPMAAGAWPAGT